MNLKIQGEDKENNAKCVFLEKGKQDREDKSHMGRSVEKFLRFTFLKQRRQLKRLYYTNRNVSCPS